MKCYEQTSCTQQERSTCCVWQRFSEVPEDMENIACWIFKGGSDMSNKEHHARCRQCGYYTALHCKGGISVDDAADPVIIVCEGVMNNDRSGTLSRIWESLRQRSKNRVLLDLSKTITLYSGGLGVITTISKEIKDAGGLFMVYCPPGFVKNYLQTLKIDRVVNVVSDRKEARAVWDAYKTAEEEKAAQLAALAAAENAAQKAAQEAARKAEQQAAEAAVQKEAEKMARQEALRAAQHAAKNDVQDRVSPIAAEVKPEKIQPASGALMKMPYCFDYWKGHNPKNANRCNECFRKIKPSSQPCWLIVSTADGVVCRYLNEDCAACAYYIKFGQKNE